MGKNHSSMVVLRIWPKFRWMLPMGVSNSRTKYEPETQRWQPGTGVASAEPPFQNLQFRTKISLFLPKTALELAENGQMRGNGDYSTHAARRLCAEGPSRALSVHNMSANLPQKAPNPWYTLEDPISFCSFRCHGGGRVGQEVEHKHRTNTPSVSSYHPPPFPCCGLGCGAPTCFA